LLTEALFFSLFLSKEKIRKLVYQVCSKSGSLDIGQLPQVVNFELSNAAEDYVHRTARTGRAGNEGKSIYWFALMNRSLRH